MKKEHMDIAKKNNTTLENYVSDMTTRKNYDLTSVIYLSAVKVSHCRIAAGDSIEKEEAKSKHQRIHLPARPVFKKSDLKLFIKSNTAWITYFHLPPKKPYSSP